MLPTWPSLHQQEAWIASCSAATMISCSVASMVTAPLMACACCRVLASLSSSLLDASLCSAAAAVVALSCGLQAAFFPRCSAMEPAQMGVPPKPAGGTHSAPVGSLREQLPQLPPLPPPQPLPGATLPAQAQQRWQASVPNAGTRLPNPTPVQPGLTGASSATPFAGWASWSGFPSAAAEEPSVEEPNGPNTTSSWSLEWLPSGCQLPDF